MMNTCKTLYQVVRGSRVYGEFTTPAFAENLQNNLNWFNRTDEYKIKELKANEDN